MSRPMGRPGPAAPCRPWAPGSGEAASRWDRAPKCSAGVCLDGSPHGWGGLSRGRVTGGGQGLPHGPCDRAHPEPWAGSRPGGRPPVADSSGRGSRMTLDVSSRCVWPRWGAVSGSHPWGHKLREGGRRSSSGQHLAGPAGPAVRSGPLPPSAPAVPAAALPAVGPQRGCSPGRPSRPCGVITPQASHPHRQRTLLDEAAWSPLARVVSSKAGPSIGRQTEDASFILNL